MATISLNASVGRTYKDGHSDVQASAVTSHVTLSWDNSVITHRQQLRDAVALIMAQINGGHSGGLAE
jgi:hypothetical protein